MSRISDFRFQISDFGSGVPSIWRARVCARAATLAVVAIMLFTGPVLADTVTLRDTDDLIQGTWKDIIVRHPGGIQLDVVPATAEKIFEAPAVTDIPEGITLARDQESFVLKETHIMGLAVFKGKLYAASSTDEGGTLKHEPRESVPWAKVYEQSGKGWKKVLDIDKRQTYVASSLQVSGMEVVGDHLFVCADGGPRFDGVRWSKGGAYGAIFDPSDNGFIYGFSHTLYFMDSFKPDGSYEKLNCVRAPVTGWALTAAAQVNGVFYGGTNLNCSIINATEIMDPTIVWEHPTEQRVGAMIAYGNRLFIGTAGPRGEVWAMSSRPYQPPDTSRYKKEAAKWVTRQALEDWARYEREHTVRIDDFDGLSDTWVRSVHRFRIYDGVLYAATGTAYENPGIVSRFDGRRFKPVVKAAAHGAMAMAMDSDAMLVGTYPDARVFRWARRFAKTGVYTSGRINDDDANVPKATVSWEAELNGGTIEVSISNDGGKTWQRLAASGKTATFAGAGGDLRLKAKLTRAKKPHTTPVLKGWTVKF